MKKQVKFCLFIGLLFFIILASVLSYNFGKNNKEELDVPSKCYTNLQPEEYFTGIPLAIVGSGKGTFNIQMQKDLRKIYTEQTAGTGSMRPLMGKANILIYIIPKKEEIYVGDIIIFTNKIYKKKIVHRVIKIENGTYITKGDNNAIEDNYKVNFEDIKGKIIGVLW